jgi:hypothetical protein
MAVKKALDRRFVEVGDDVNAVGKSRKRLRNAPPPL